MDVTRLPATERLTGYALDRLPIAELLADNRAAVFPGAARDWPLVQAGLDSPEAALAHMAQFDAGVPLTVYRGGPEIAGRMFYNDDLTGFNFDSGRTPFPILLDQLYDAVRTEPQPSIYVGSTDLDTFFPGLRDEGDVAAAHPLFANHDPIVSIWMGTRTTATAHYDYSNNLAVCVAGRRRFTLFPPEQGANLYPGPLSPTPGGQVVSMVDFSAPDFDRHPQFAEALAHAQVAELEPGDVLFYPAMWWHHVEALSPFNILINTWWNMVPPHVDTPQTTLLHAILSLRDRPLHEKAAWRALFDYYVFGEADRAGAHIPPHARGELEAPLDPVRARRLRAMILNRLNR